MPDPAQQSLFPPTAEQPPTLAALLQEARLRARTGAQGGAVGAVVARLAAEGGTMPIDALRREGFPDDVIAAALTQSPEDKRVKARAKLGVIDGVSLAWLTTTGWQSAGQASRRERPPTAESAAHAGAPVELGTWLHKQLEPWPTVGLEVVTGEPCREFSERVKALAWSRIQGAGDTTGNAGSLTGGLVPDALLCERFADARTFTDAWRHEPIDHRDLTEHVLALEVEDTRKSDGPLGWKVDKWQAAIDLGACYGVVWLVRRRQVAERLRGLGVGRDTGKQLLVPASAVGLQGDALDYPAHWWPLRVAALQEGS